jgi:hypothetical protein
VETRTAIIARGGDDQNIVVRTQTDRLSQQGIGLAGWDQFPTADVDDLSAMVDGLADGPGQVELRTRGKKPILSFREHGHNEAPTARRNTTDGAAMLAKDHAGDKSPMPRSRP